MQIGGVNTHKNEQFPEKATKKERKKHANLEDLNSLQFAIRNFKSFTLMTFQKDAEELKNRKSRHPKP